MNIGPKTFFSYLILLHIFTAYTILLLNQRSAAPEQPPAPTHFKAYTTHTQKIIDLGNNKPAPPVVADRVSENAQPQESKLPFEKVKNAYIAEFSTYRKHVFGYFDIEIIMSGLERYFTDDKQVIIDIGTNIGRCSEKILTLFTDLDCKNYVEVYGSKNMWVGCKNSPTPVLAFEPSPATFAKLSKRAEEQNWKKHTNYQIFNVAVGSEDKNVTFYTNGEEGDENASLDAKAADSKDRTKGVEIEMVTLDRFMNKYWESNGDRGIFLLKIDAEGYDAEVIKGAEDILRNRKAKFISFEYNWKWFTEDRKTTLRDVVQDVMYSSDYLCFFITKKNLIPLWNDWWDDKYEIKYWSNAFCGKKGDEDLKKFIVAYNENVEMSLRAFDFV